MSEAVEAIRERADRVSYSVEDVVQASLDRKTLLEALDAAHQHLAEGAVIMEALLADRERCAKERADCEDEIMDLVGELLWAEEGC